MGKTQHQPFQLSSNAALGSTDGRSTGAKMKISVKKVLAENHALMTRQPLEGRPENYERRPPRTG